MGIKDNERLRNMEQMKVTEVKICNKER